MSQVRHIKNSPSTSPEHEYREYAPCAALKPYVNCFWSSNSAASIHDPVKRIVLPDGCIDIIFDFSIDRTDPAFVIGAMTTPIINQCKHLLGIRFQPGLAFCFLKTPLHHFTDLKVDLTAVWGSGSQEIYLKLLESNLSGSLTILTHELIGRLGCAAAPDRRILTAVSLIKKNNGAMSVQQLSNRLGLSRQHLKRKCAQYTGLSPKNLLRTYRFKALMKRAKSTETVSWSHLAVDCGYYDQAHLISEFKTMTGLTPAQYFVKK